MKNVPIDAKLLQARGVFETMRAFRGKTVLLDDHLLRIRNSCALIGIKYCFKDAKIKSEIKEFINSGHLTDARVKLCVWKEDDAARSFITAQEYKPFNKAKYTKGFSLSVSPLAANEGSYLSRIKCLDRMLYDLSLEEAVKKQSDDALLLNNRQEIAETSRSNIFLVKGERIFTPSLECGCLPGITRFAVIDIARRSNIPLVEGEFSLQDLYGSDEAFLTNSLMGIMPIGRVENQIIGKKKCREITDLITRKYNCLLK